MAQKRKSSKKKSNVIVSTFLPQRRLHRSALLIVVLAVAVIGVKLTFFSQAAGNFTYLATHPQAASQPTAWGKTIQTLKVWNGKIYSGYGDWNYNTGPVNITPFDPVTKTFAAAPEVADLTETIDKFRVINGKLYAPSIDPRYGYSTDFAVGSLAGSVPAWQQVGPHHALKGVMGSHLFDMATLTGTDIWIVGADYYTADAVVYRSVDNGVSWQKMLAVPPPASDPAARFYFVGVLNGKLYVQAAWFNGGGEANSHVFDGTAWSNGPNLMVNGVGYHPDVFAGRMVYLGWMTPSVTALASFDGSTAKLVSAPTTAFYDYTIDGSMLYAVGYNNMVYRTPDLVTWTAVTTAPGGGRSIAVHNNIVYVGTTDSKIYGYDLANGVLGDASAQAPSPAKKCRGKRC